MSNITSQRKYLQRAHAGGTSKKILILESKWNHTLILKEKRASEAIKNQLERSLSNKERQIL